jgi:hypothetical protein
MASVTNLDSVRAKIALSPLQSPAGGYKTATGANIWDVVSITHVAGLATMTVTGHQFNTGDAVVITAADQAGYNGSKVVTWDSVDTVTFAVDPATVTPATGTIKATKTVTRTVTALTLTGETGTAAVVGHKFANSSSVLIAGATPSEYNGTFTITTSGADAFTIDYAAVVDTTAELRTAIDQAVQDQGWTIHDATAGANAKVYTRADVGAASNAYQIVNVGSNKVAGTASGLVNDVPATRGYQDVRFGVAKAPGDASGLAADVPATAGYQVVNVGGAKVAGDATGLLNDPTAYTASISVDGNVRAISVVGSAAQTYTTLLAEIQTDLDAGGVVGTVTLNGGNIRVTSLTTGVASSVAITAGTLFAAPLAGFVGLDAAVPGVNTIVTTYTATITQDGTPRLVTVAGGTAYPTIGSVITKILADGAGWLNGTGLYNSGSGNRDLRVVSSSIVPGVASTISIADGVTPLFATLANYSSLQAPVGGVDTIVTTYTATVTVNPGAHVQAVSIGGGTAQTYGDLITQINADLGGFAIASLSPIRTGGTANDIVITSVATGATATVAITAGTLFAAPLAGFVGLDAAVPGASGSVVPTSGHDYVNIQFASGYDASPTGLATTTDATRGKSTVAFTSAPTLRPGSRLGTLVAGPHTVTVTVDGGAPVTVTVDTNGLDQASNSLDTLESVAASINTQLQAHGANCVATANAFVITSKTAGAASSVIVTIPASSGTDLVGAINTAVTATNSNVRADGANAAAKLYTASVDVDGGTIRAISVAGSAAQTMGTLITEIQTDLDAGGACAVVAIVDNTIRITSNSTGVSSSVAITDTNLFSSLRNFAGESTNSVGTAIAHYANVDLNTAGKVLVSEWTTWDAGTHAGTGEVLDNRHQVNIGDRPGTMYVYTFAENRPPLYFFN